jgi:hypothetical protein
VSISNQLTYQTKIQICLIFKAQGSATCETWDSGPNLLYPIDDTKNYYFLCCFVNSTMKFEVAHEKLTSHLLNSN